MSGPDKVSTPNADDHFKTNGNHELTEDANGTTLSLRALVSTKEAGVIIGKGGKNVADLREETDVKAGVSKVIQGVHDRVLTVSGSLEGVAKAFSMIAGTILENTTIPNTLTSTITPTTATIRLLISHNLMGSIIGRQGVKIKNIQDMSGVRMVASKDMLPQSTERVVDVQGTPEGIHIAITEIGRCLLEDWERGVGTVLYNPSVRLTHSNYSSDWDKKPASPTSTGRPNSSSTSAAFLNNPNIRTQNISIPNDMVGCIIGKGGAKIAEIRQLSGSRISIAKTPHDESGERMFTIQGTPEANEKALYLLFAQLESEKERRLNSAENEIYKATYSGVPVYEFLCKGVAVMRRRSDSYLNATQILKVADFDKPQRTRILEREVQKGEHEKVQGGYGKYQGTWVPFERGIELAKQYNVLHDLQPIFDYNQDGKSPPLAPKHITAATNRPRKPRVPKPVTGGKGGKKMPRALSNRMSMRSYSDSEISEDMLDESEDELASTEYPVERGRYNVIVDGQFDSDVSSLSSHSNDGSVGRSQKRRRVMNRVHAYGGKQSSRYAKVLLQYFISDQQDIPKLLLDPPPDLDINLVIDEEGHSSLHWAAAMANMEVVQLLISHQVNIASVNYSGQTALMRSVLFTNNYTDRSFADLLEFLQKTIFTIDKQDRTVFHHVCATAGVSGKLAASKYYMDCLLDKLADFPSELVELLNVQDEGGNTALLVAAAGGAKKICRLLLSKGADPTIPNRAGKRAQDYLEGGGGMVGLASVDIEEYVPEAVASAFRHLHDGYEEDLKEKEESLQQVNDMMIDLQRQISENEKALIEINDKANDLQAAQTKIQELEAKLRNIVMKRHIRRIKDMALNDESNEEHNANSFLHSDPVESQDVKASTQQHEVKPEPVHHPKSVGELFPTPVTSQLPSTQTNNKSETADTDPETRAAQLQEELRSHKDGFERLIAEYVTLAAESSAQSENYRRLIALSCGIPYEEVDSLLNPLAAQLAVEEGY
ncbi:hypothetical protein BZG36_02295 [Bifiguratus adelaidae]|uniref:HTH APSES-type domain-containing protein n=1 Tax=Bifiguratus adelaidae TaxID=1938954 RepID=A0A261Y3S0_9FUNG|nr:hypothetical protein BZG36_02295 [Bifiguratus adelaidae]